MNPHVLFTQSGRWLMAPEEVNSLERRVAELGGVEALIRDGPKLLAANGIERDKSTGLSMRGDVAIIPIKGVLMPERNCASSWNGWTTCDALVQDIETAMEDPTVREIVFDVDSPGGYVTGVQETAEYIAAQRGRKRMTAHVGGACASGAYWLASAADEIVTGITGEVGCIGVVTTYSRSKGDTKTFVSTQSPMKRPDVDSEEGAAAVQAVIDQLASVFIADVAKNRGVSEEKVVSDFGRGWVKVGCDAVNSGLADRVASFEALMSELENKKTGGMKMAEPKMELEITAESLSVSHPEVYKAIAAEGAAAERERILAIQSMAFSGMEDFCAALVQEGVTAGEAAIKINAEEKRRRASALADLHADAEEAGKVAASSAPDAAAEAEAHDEAEERELAKQAAKAAGIAREV